MATKSQTENKLTDDASPDSLFERYQTIQWIQAQIQQCEIQLQLHKASSGGSPCGSADLRMKELEKELKDISGKQIIRTTMHKSLQLGHVMLTNFIPSTDAEKCDLGSVEFQEVSLPLMDKSERLVADIATAHKEIEDKEKILDDLKQSNIELRESNKTLMNKLKALREARQTFAKQAGDSPQVTKAKETYEWMTDKVEMMQKTLLGVLVGSGIDWDETPELQNLVLTLGQSPRDLIK